MDGTSSVFSSEIVSSILRFVGDEDSDVTARRAVQAAACVNKTWQTVAARIRTLHFLEKHSVLKQENDYFTSLDKIEFVDLSLKFFAEERLTHLVPLSSLTVLDLTKCIQVTDKGLVSVGSLTTLTTLILYRCSQITDTGLSSLQALTSLKLLDLGECSQITDGGLVSVRAFIALRSLSLYGCYRITINGLRSLTTLICLECLDIRRCEQLTEYILRGQEEESGSSSPTLSDEEIGTDTYREAEQCG